MSTPVLLISLGGMVLLVWSLGFFAGRGRTEERLSCPADGKSRTVVFERRLDPLWGLGRPSDVVACSAFDPPTGVSCPKGCLARARLPAELNHFPI